MSCADLLLREAGRTGNVEQARLALKKGVHNRSEVMANTAKCGHINVVKLLLEAGTNSYDWTMASAAYGAIWP